MRYTNWLFFLVTLSLFVACTDSSEIQDQNKAIVQNAVEEIYTNRNINYVDTVFAKNYQHNGSEVGVENLQKLVSSVLEAFPDLQVTDEIILAEGNHVAWTITLNGTHQGQVWGVSATDEEISWQATIISRISDGKIVEGWGSGTLQQKLQAIETNN